MARNFLATPSGVVAQNDGRTNILVLGRSGNGQDSPDLTDTMILTSISPDSKKITMISIPRDLWVDTLKAKVNTAYYYGKQKGDSSIAGLTLAKSTVEEIMGVPVHYGLVIDFSGFKKIIDDMGGVDVQVDKSFIDNEYPVPGKEADLCNGDRTYACRYQTVEFKEGVTHMDGSTALKFVRSRHAQGDEGTDFARSARQQKVIKAIATKALMPATFTNPSKDSLLVNDINSSIETDITTPQRAVLGRWVFDLRNNIRSEAIPENLLYTPGLLAIYQKQYVLIPNKGNWNEIQSWAKLVLP